MSKILVIGDLIIDHYINGELSKFSTEAPVPVISFDNIITRLGGAGNVAKNLKDLEADFNCVFIAPSRLLPLLQNSLGDKSTIIVDDSYSISNKTRILSNKQHLVRLDNDNKKYPKEKTIELYIKVIKEKLHSRSFKYLVIADYCKKLLSHGHLLEIMDIAIKNEVKVLVDTKRKDISVFSGAYLITPNQAEKELFNTNDLYAIDYCLTTMGSKGMSLTNYKLEEIYSCPALKVESADVCGAGDTVMATIAWGLSTGSPLQEAVKFAQITSGMVVNKFGTSSITLDEIGTYMAKGLHKIVNLSELKFVIANQRKSHKKIAFTNGCFDVLHEGHLTLLNSIPSDYYLIVGVDSNKRVSYLKGSDRPINSNRLPSLAAIKNVSAVIEFDSGVELENIIYACKPDLFVKGSDYNNTDVIGKKFVESYGGIFQTVPRESTISTSNIIS